MEHYQFSGGMIRWFFELEGGIYQVNSQQYWEALPRPEIMGVLYRHDKKRLLNWLEARAKERVLAQTLWEKRTLPKAQIRLPRSPVGRPKGSGMSAKQRAFHKKLLLKPKPCPPWLELEPDGKRYYAAFPMSDHDWINAMFSLYAQGRSRWL